MRAAVAIVLLPALALAEPPCRREGERVTCTKDGFGKLVKVAIDLQAEAKTAAATAAAREADLKACEAGLKEALARPVVVDAGPPDALVLALVGTGGLVVGLLVGFAIAAQLR